MGKRGAARPEMPETPSRTHRYNGQAVRNRNLTIRVRGRRATAPEKPVSDPETLGFQNHLKTVGGAELVL